MRVLQSLAASTKRSYSDQISSSLQLRPNQLPATICGNNEITCGLPMETPTQLYGMWQPGRIRTRRFVGGMNSGTYDGKSRASN